MSIQQLEIQQINIQQFHTVWQQDHPIVIDVREPDEYGKGHVPGAQNIPLKTIISHADSLSAKQPVYLICQSGMRSNKAADTLIHNDDSVDAINIAGGTLAWISAGYDTNQGLTP